LPYCDDCGLLRNIWRSHLPSKLKPLEAGKQGGPWWL
jgi:hypothetical protein